MTFCKEHIWFWFRCAHMAQLKIVTVTIAAPLEMFCKNNKTNCSVGLESLSRKGEREEENIYLMMFSLVSLKPRLFLYALINKPWHASFYSKYHTQRSCLQEECQWKTPGRTDNFTINFHCSFMIRDYVSSCSLLKSFNLISSHVPFEPDNRSLFSQFSLAGVPRHDLVLWDWCMKCFFTGPIAWNAKFPRDGVSNVYSPAFF